MLADGLAIVACEAACSTYTYSTTLDDMVASCGRALPTVDPDLVPQVRQGLGRMRRAWDDAREHPKRSPPHSTICPWPASRTSSPRARHLDVIGTQPELPRPDRPLVVGIDGRCVRSAAPPGRRCPARSRSAACRATVASPTPPSCSRAGCARSASPFEPSGRPCGVRESSPPVAERAQVQEPRVYRPGRVDAGGDSVPRWGPHRPRRCGAPLGRRSARSPHRFVDRRRAGRQAPTDLRAEAGPSG